MRPYNVFVAPMPGKPEPKGPLPVLAENFQDAQEEVACIAGVASDRCLALRAEDWSDELMTLLEAANRRADAEVRELRKMHAKILGCSVEELDARLSADKAAEETARAERRGAVPKPARRAARARDGAAIGTAQLYPRQRELLRNVRVDGNVAVYVPEERIPDWAELKKVLVALGGKWKTRTGFIFPEDVDAAEKIRLALETGEIFDPKAADFYPTPRALADRVIELAGIEPGDTVLEPSAGKGALALAVRRACSGAFVTCIEALPENASALRGEKFVVTVGNFLDSRTEPSAPFDRVVMNPPFSRRADIAHVKRALRFLKPGGRLVSIMSAGIEFRQDKETVDFRALVEKRGGRIERNPDGSFLESGTGVRTVTVVIPGEKPVPKWCRR